MYKSWANIILNANIYVVEFQKTGLRRTHILKINYLLISAILGANYNKKNIRSTEICVLLLRWIFQSTELIVLIIFEA
jgi:hypothetical protein